MKDIHSFAKKELIDDLYFHFEDKYRDIIGLLEKEEITGTFIIETLRDIVWNAGSVWDNEVASHKFWEEISEKLKDTKMFPNDRELLESTLAWRDKSAAEVFEEIDRFWCYAGSDNNCLVRRDVIDVWHCRACVYLDSYSVTYTSLVARIFKKYEQFDPESANNAILRFIDERLPYLQAQIVKHQIDVDVAALVRDKPTPVLSDVEDAILKKALENLKVFSSEIEDLV